MLTPEQLNQIPEHFVQQIQSLEDYIIADIARRVGKEGQFTATAVLQTEKALSLGADIEDIERLIQFVTGATLGDIDRTIREAIDSSISTDNVIYKGAGYDPIDLQRSPVLMDILESGIRQTKAEFQNLTATMGFATLSGGKEIFQDLTSFYHTTLNMAAMQVSTGVLSLDSAKRFAVKKMADSGLRYVDYATGHMNRVDVAVRRAILTGVNQLNLRLTDKIMENLGAEYVEVTAHAGARPSHAVWQGQVYHVGGSKNGYDDFETSTGYGTGAGLGGWNCRHSYFPFFPGISERAYTDEQLKRLDNPSFTFEDRSYTHYEATQYQRQLETAMRKTKRELIAYDAAEMQDDFLAASIRLNGQKERYITFSKAAGLPMQNIRAEQYGYSRRLSQKSVWVVKPTRRTTNREPFEFLQIPMQKRKIKEIARKYRWDLSGLIVKIQRDEALARLGYCGSTDYDRIGRIDLYPQAFSSEENVIRTLIHENCHVLQLKKYGKGYTQNNLSRMEKVAERYEEMWYNYLKRRL